MLVLLIVLTAAVYSSAYHLDYVDYDDPALVTQNPHIQHGLTTSAAREAFTTYTVGNYVPIMLVSYSIDQTLFALKPGPMHVENVLLHLLGGLLLWRLILVATGHSARGFVIAALFLVHPMHVESVAWISERRDVLSTPLLLAAMLCYVRYAKTETARYRLMAYLGMLICFALSLLSKSMGVTLPAVLLLMDLWPLKRWKTRGVKLLLVEKIPLILLSLAASVVSGLAQQSAGATSTLLELGLWDRIANALVCYVVYIAKLLVPTNLAVFYQHPGTRPLPAVVAAAGLLLLITVVCWRARISRPYLMIGWLWFIGTLVPVIGIVQVGSQSMADRYSYFPSIGLSIAIVWFFADVLRNSKVKLALTATILITLSITAWQQVLYWQNSHALFAHAAAVAEPNPVAHVQLGKEAYERGDLNTAVAQYKAALHPFPNARAFNGLGNCMLNSDRTQAIAYYREAVWLNRTAALFRISLAHALWLDGQSNEAVLEAKRAVELEPSSASARAELDRVLHEQPLKKSGGRSG